MGSDIAAESFARLLAHRSVVEDAVPFLYRIALNQVRDRWRHQQVLVQPGGTASFAFSRNTSTPNDGIPCTMVTNVEVALPGSATAEPSGSAFTACGNGAKDEPIEVGPFVTGPGATLRG